MPNPRHLAAEILLPLALLLAAEVGFRFYVHATPTLGPPRFFSSSISSGKYLAFARKAMNTPRTDVFLLGLSPIMSLRAGRLVDDLAAQGRAVSAFNFSFPQHPVDFDRLLMRDVLLDGRQPPRVVVYGVMPLNLLLEADPMTTLKRTRTLAGFQLHDPSPAGRLRALVPLQLDLFLYRDVFRAAVSGAEQKPDLWAKTAREFDDRGDLPPAPPRPAPTRLRYREVMKYKKPLRDFSSLLASGSFARRLAVLASFCDERGTHLFLVNTAVSPFFLELLPNGRRDYDAFVRQMRSVAFASGVSFLDLSGPDLGRPEDFVDSHHLNRRAALAATDRIAAFLLSENLLNEE